MKALSIEEINILEEDDCIYIISKNNTGYYQILYIDDVYLELQGFDNFNYNFYYEDYGKTWVAYKNKEQANCKGELVELPCKVGDKVYYLNTFPSISLKTNTIYKGEVVRFHILNSFNSLDMTISLEIKIHNEYGTTAIPNIKDFGVLIFETKEQAEQKLKELRGKV